MMTDRIVKTSRRVYDRLLLLYPREFREEYRTSMGQVFADQCRTAVRDKGTPGIASLWLRTLIDLSVSVVREHIAVPGAAAGLLEKAPDAPLPWKGVALVLIPGLVFFIGQIGQLAGWNWFYWLTVWGAWLMIVPVFWALITFRKFPIWGLIPVGILIRTLFFEYGWQGIIKYLRFNSILTALLGRNWILQSEKYSWLIKIIAGISRIHKGYPAWFMVMQVGFLAGLIGLIIFLVIQIIRKWGFPRAAFIWTGVFILLISADAALKIIYYVNNIYNWYAWIYSVIENIGYLLVVLIGCYFSRRHGGSAFLIILGYYVPKILWGYFWEGYFTSSVFTALTITSVVVYRILVTLIAPLWLVRSASDQAQRRTGTIGLLFALGIPIAAYCADIILVSPFTGVNIDLLNGYIALSWELIALAGIFLGISLFRHEPQKRTGNQLEKGITRTA